MNKISRLEFHISYKCNNNCIFCGEHFRLVQNKNKFVSLVEIKKKLSEKKKKGLSHITLTGGEPTFHPDFLKILRFAKKLGFKTYVSTNGGLFAYEGFARQAAPYLDEICFSIHGHNARVHNLHTQNKRSFEILEKALGNFQNYLKETKGFSNTVVTALNFKSLNNILDLAVRRGLSQMLFSNVVPEGSGLSDYDRLAIKLDRFKKIIPSLVRAAEQKSMTIRFFGVPLCVIGKKFSMYSNDIWWSPRLTIEKARKESGLVLDEVESRLPVRERIMPKKCYLCRERNRCGGVFSEYFKKFSDQELKSFKA